MEFCETDERIKQEIDRCDESSSQRGMKIGHFWLVAPRVINWGDFQMNEIVVNCYTYTISSTKDKNTPYNYYLNDDNRISRIVSLCWLISLRKWLSRIKLRRYTIWRNFKTALCNCNPPANFEIHSTHQASTYVTVRGIREIAFRVLGRLMCIPGTLDAYRSSPRGLKVVFSCAGKERSYEDTTPGELNMSSSKARTLISSTSSL